MNELSVTEQESILALLRLGWSIRRVARETGRRHETIRRYGQQAGVLQIRAPLPVESQASAIAVPAESVKLHVGTTDKPQIAGTEVPTDPASKPHTATGEVLTDVPPRNAAQCQRRDKANPVSSR